MTFYPFSLSVTSATSTHMRAESSGERMIVDAADDTNMTIRCESRDGVTTYAARGNLLSPGFRNELALERARIQDYGNASDELKATCDLAALWVHRSELTFWDKVDKRFVRAVDAPSWLRDDTSDEAVE